tara:strand:- start:219 stop:482 length:264 start_codon:yes stop_codon:yes gene_type:complete
MHMDLLLTMVLVRREGQCDSVPVGQQQYQPFHPLKGLMMTCGTYQSKMKSASLLQDCREQRGIQRVRCGTGKAKMYHSIGNLLLHSL